MIPRTYYDDNPEDRAYVQDFWSWLQHQPRDAWLLWARRANWDNAETIFQAMVDRRDCDLALMAWLFWACDPAAYVRTPGAYRPDALIAKIVETMQLRPCAAAGLFCDRHEIAMSAHHYLRALRDVAPGQAPFRLPRPLCGPFGGRRAALPARYDRQTEQDLQEIFRVMSGGLPRSEDEHARDLAAGGGAWLKDQMALPEPPQDPVAAYAHLDDAGYVEAMFGKSAAFDAALARHRAGTRPRRPWWPFG